MSKHTPTTWQPQLNQPPHVPRIHGDLDTTLVCVLGNAEDPFKAADEWEANAARIAACVNAFHSPDREIATEQITVSLFWEIVDGLEDAHKAIESCLHAEQNPGNGRIEAIAGEAVWGARKSKRALLAKLEPQK